MKKVLLIVVLLLVGILSAANSVRNSREVLEFSIPDTPEQQNYPNNQNPYGNSWDDLGWTSITVEDTGTIGMIEISGELFSDNYPGEGSLWLMSPESIVALVSDSFISGTEEVSFEIDSFSGESCMGEWILYFEDNYNDGGHALNNGIFIINLEGAVHNLTQNVWYSSIQAGINAADDSDVIIVEPGIYYENINFAGKAITLGSYYYTTQDTSYISQTIIDGSNNSRVVKFEYGEGAGSILTGFTITNGSATSGGGILCISASPTLENLLITNNTASSQGGGLRFVESNSTLCNITISNNSAEYGGGLVCIGSDISFENVIISNNSATWDGGLECDESNVSLENAIISNNSATWSGGCSINMFSNITFKNVVITNNSTEYGGGCSIGMNSNGIFENVVISNNSTEYGGTCSIDMQSNATFKNVTVADNEGTGISCFDSNIVAINCVLWNNTEELNYDAFDSSAIIANTDIMGGLEGIETQNPELIIWLDGNIDTDPLFEDAANQNYHLSSYSPCIDAGTAYLEYEGEVLIDLEEYQYSGLSPDMGAFENGNLIVFGDVNDDGEICSYDVSLIMMLVVGMDPIAEDPVPWESWRCMRADVDLDGELNAVDGSYILEYIVCLRDSLPVIRRIRR